MIKGSVTDKMYHGCVIGYANGERKLIDFEKLKVACCQPMIHLGQIHETWKCKRGTQKKIDGCST